MFVQIITGKTKDGPGLQAYGRTWQTEVRPSAVGYIGSTAGVAPDGTFVVVVQFTDDAAAKENSNLPQQTKWFEGMTKFFAGEPTFRESSDTSLLFDGPSTKAGFVQVMESKCTDRAKAEAMESGEMLDALRSARPDLLGGLRVWLDGNKVVEVAYFTSEADARAAEKSTEFDAPQQDFASLYEDMTYTDLPDPEIFQA